MHVHYYNAVKNIGHHACLKENEHLFCYRAYLEENFVVVYVHPLICVR